MRMTKALLAFFCAVFLFACSPDSPTPKKQDEKQGVRPPAQQEERIPETKPDTKDLKKKRKRPLPYGEYQRGEFPFGFKSDSIPDCDATIEATSISSQDGKKTFVEHTVLLCERTIDQNRFNWGVVIESQKLAHGDMWVHLNENDTWSVMTYRKPETEEDMRKLQTEGREVFQERTYVTSDDLPLVIKRIPKHVLKKLILSFVAYYNGAYEIYVFDGSKVMAEKVAGIINK